MGCFILKNLNYRKVCFACTTPYQVLGAISITREEKLLADIYIFGMFADYYELAERLKTLSIFENVIAVDCQKIGFLKKGNLKNATRIMAFYQMLFPEKYLRDYLDSNIAYENYYSSSRAHVKLLLQRVLLKRNPNMRIVIYDDGLGSYLTNSHVLRVSKLRRIAEKVLGWNLFKTEQVSIELYLPQIAQIPPELKKCPITKMPQINLQNPIERDVLKTIFGVSLETNYCERVIFFDNVRGSKSRKQMFEKIDACIEEIVDLVGADDVLYKSHPRSREKINLNLNEMKEPSIPMEVLYSDMEDLESRILIAYNSTATYTPKMLFGVEPWVINLHRIVGPPLQETSETLYQTFLSIYENKNRLLAPNSIDELRTMLFDILNYDNEEHYE